ncbi:MAG TPA: hypothetical protein VMU18_02785 [Rhodoblastus sp.]|nr:hypothetical protein [Rhodoblastus sp.]
MRDLLTYIGIALILALSAAFAAPYVLDFDAYRARIAAELSQASGARVRLDGPIALRFLPTPRFSAQNVGLAGAFGHIEAKKARFALALPGLLQGRLQFTRAALEDANIVIDADKAARSRPPLALQFDNLTLRRARVAILRGGATAVEIDGLGLVADFPGPQGPFKGHGGFESQGARIAFSFGTDSLAKNILPLKASLTWPGETAQLDLDGGVSFDNGPIFEGAAKASGKAAPGPWSAQANGAVGLGEIQAKEFSAVLGDGPLGGKISGAGHYDRRGGRLELTAQATALDGPWVDLLRSHLSAESGAVALDLRLGADRLNWRGIDWSQASLHWRSGSPARIEATGPGATRIEIDAAPEGDGWRGAAELTTRDLIAFATALGEAAPVASQALTRLDLHALAAKGVFAATPEKWALTGASFDLGRNRFSGDAALSFERSNAPPLLSARLTASELDLDALPALASAPPKGFDLDLGLEARDVRSTRAGALSGPGGRIAAHVLRAGEVTRLERLDLHNIGGADLTASASWGKDFSSLQGEGRLKAADLAPLAQALARVAPGAATNAFMERAKSLSPADLAGKAADGGLNVNGSLGATKINLSLPQASAPRAIAIELNAPEAGLLLNQLGARVVWTHKLGPARLTARAEPDQNREGGRIFTAAADLAGLHGELRGALVGSAIEGDAALSGDAGKILSLATAANSPAPLRFAARAHWRDGALTLQNLSGDWAGDRVAGDLTIDSHGVQGALRCDRLSGSAFAAFVLGPPAPVKAGALWSSLSFAPAIFDPPPLALAIETDRLEPLGGGARLHLRLGPGVLAVDQAEAHAFAGLLRGKFGLRRAGGQVILSGEAEAENIALQNPAFSARLDGALKFAGEGKSAAALVGALAGEGAVRLNDLVLQQAAANAPDEALQASEANEAPFDAKAVAQSLDKAFAGEVLRRPEAAFAAQLAGGRLALIPKDDGARGLDGGFDLRDGAFSLGLAASARRLPVGWSGPPPSGAAIWSGPWRAPIRHVEANDFVNAVAVRALEREQARIDQQKREDRERLRALSAQPAP